MGPKIDLSDTAPKHGFILPKDKYDHAIDYLTEHPEKIRSAWGNPQNYEGQGGELFGFVGPDWKSNSNPGMHERLETGTCGCLQQIRQSFKHGGDGKSGNMAMSHWPRLWQKIGEDRSLPHDEDEITVADLPVFAMWQREIDEKRKQDGMVVL